MASQEPFWYGVDSYDQYIQNSKRDVNFMVQQFEMKKSADAYARRQVHKTGVLNTNILHNYKLTDDLFLRQTTTPDGKSHGMVMFLDLSGSMSGITNKTVKQILTLVQFCRKVQIPFDVYTFTTGTNYRGVTPVQDDVSYQDLALVNVLTSNCKSKQLDTDMRNLFLHSMWCDGYQRSNAASVLAMGGTPLNNALTLAPQLISEFKARTKAQKVSFVCITDGESAPLSYYTERQYRYGDPELRPTYEYYKDTMMRYQGKSSVFEFGRHGTGQIAKWVEDNTEDVTITNIFLGTQGVSTHYLRHFGVEMSKDFNKNNGFVAHTDEFWQTICVLSPKGFKDPESDELNVEDGASKAKIKSALKKQLKNKMSSKVILTQLVDQFS